MDLLGMLKTWGRGLGSFALDRLLPAVILLVMGILAVRLILRILQTMLHKTKLDAGVVLLVRRILKVALYLLLLLMVASKMGIDVTGVVALASVLTLAISLSVQTALTNVIGGFTLLNTKPFVAGDYVEIAGQSGTVQDVGSSSGSGSQDQTGAPSIWPTILMMVASFSGSIRRSPMT